MLQALGDMAVVASLLHGDNVLMPHACEGQSKMPSQQLAR
jgi:hypothetical protein